MNIMHINHIPIPPNSNITAPGGNIIRHIRQATAVNIANTNENLFIICFSLSVIALLS